jgi:acyl dehydratase
MNGKNPISERFATVSIRYNIDISGVSRSQRALLVDANADGRVPVGILAVMTDESERPVRYFEDYVPGLTVDCGTFTLSEAEIIAFAKEYDPQPFHVDPAAAAAGPVGGLIASGWHTTSMMMRLLVERFISGETGLGAGGIDEIRWPRPVRPGDTLHVRASVLDARRSRSKPDRGIVVSAMEIANQDGETVMTMKATNFFLVRNAEK